MFTTDTANSQRTLAWVSSNSQREPSLYRKISQLNINNKIVKQNRIGTQEEGTDVSETKSETKSNTK